MIEIKPDVQHESSCPYCSTPLTPAQLIWHGMHTCVESNCAQCGVQIIEDLRVGHATNWSYQIDLEKGVLFGRDKVSEWLGKPLFASFQNPNQKKIEINKEIFKPYKHVIILNCIDFLYGHCLLKLLNAQRYLDGKPDHGLIVVVPKFLRWMVPDGVLEIWTVDIPLRQGQSFYPDFNEFVTQEIQRFDTVYVSQAYSHPNDFDITRFTRVVKHDFNAEELRVVFIWREDRVWIHPLLFRGLRKLNLLPLALWLQNWKIRKLFNKMQRNFPSMLFAVAGLGTKTKFPDWIEDLRVDRFTEKTEWQLCKIYSSSRLAIGVHGSNMLLPSGQAGMTIDLMPNDRWENFAQDLLYQEPDPRLAAFKYRYLLSQIKIDQLYAIAASMILDYSQFVNYMVTPEEQL